MKLKDTRAQWPNYVGEICESLTSYYVAVDPQPDEAVPITLKDFVPISLSKDGVLSSFELIDLRKSSLEIPEFQIDSRFTVCPTFEFPNPQEEYQWKWYQSANTFTIQFRELKPDCMYSNDNMCFWFLNDLLVAMKVTNCIFEQ